jgi:hypothetical protein
VRSARNSHGSALFGGGGGGGGGGSFGAHYEGFLPAGAFSGLEEKVDVLNSFTDNAFQVGTLTFAALAPAPPPKPKRRGNSRYDVSPRHREVSKMNTKIAAREVPKVHESPRERAKRERIHAAITMRRCGESKDVDPRQQAGAPGWDQAQEDAYGNGHEITTKRKIELLNGIEKLEKLRRMQTEQDRLSRKKTDIRNRRIEHQRERRARALEKEARERAAVKLQGLCRGRRDRIRVRQMRDQRNMEHHSCMRIQALHRGKRDRGRAKDKRDRDAATRRIQSIHRGRKGRKQFQERKEREMATRKIQALHRGKQGRKEARSMAARRSSDGDTRRQNEARERELAVRKIQAINRGHRDRRRVQGLKEQRKDYQEQSGAARKIQARIRGRKARLEQQQDLEEQGRAASKIQARIRGLQQRRNQGKALVAGATHPEGVRLVAMLDFEAEEKDDLDFVQGDILIGYSLEEGWWSGVKEGTETVVGDFPSNYVVREGEEAEYELEVNQSVLKNAEQEQEEKAEVPSTAVAINRGKDDLSLDMMEWLMDWVDTFKIKGVEELARALHVLGVSEAEDLKDLDDDMVEDVCLSLKKLDAKRFRRAIEGERGDANW